VSTATGVTLRPYDPADEAAVLRLIAADRLPGQPEANPAMLSDALEGRSPVDSGWWAEPDPPATHVALNAAGAVVGVLSYAVRPKDDTGMILWLHCREDAATAEALIAHAVNALAPRPVHAFHIASALTPGLEALPVRHRAVTEAALRRAGFTGERLWRYMRAELPAHGLPRAEALEAGPGPDEKNARRLEVREGRKGIAEAVVGIPVQGIGVLWRIGVEPEARGRGLGRAMLGSALGLLAGLGASEAILHVDDDAPPGDERDRTAAHALYDSAGFVEVDRLYSYTRSAGR
jgi:GNAT superfamily N-acetyltransferase